jgi:acetyltransferase-like isoleucine patch superfamily enzyme
MQKIATLIYKIARKLFLKILLILNQILTYFIFYCNNVEFKKIYSNGIPYVTVARNGKCKIGNNLKLNNNIRGNPIGRVQRCILFVNNGAELHIGNNVGMSSTAIVANQLIKIGDNVKIGGGVCIYDSDFHSLDPKIRRNADLDSKNQNTSPVFIENNVFIGAHSTLLKGVTVGKNSVIGACSVVTKSIPANEIWAGNPARFIKKL